MPYGLLSSVSLNIEPFLLMSTSTSEFVSISKSTSGHIRIFHLPDTQLMHVNFLKLAIFLRHVNDVQLYVGCESYNFDFFIGHGR